MMKASVTQWFSDESFSDLKKLWSLNNLYTLKLFYKNLPSHIEWPVYQVPFPHYSMQETSSQSKTQLWNIHQQQPKILSH